MITNPGTRFGLITKVFGLLLLFPLVTMAQTKSKPVIVSKKPSPFFELASEQRDRARRTLMADRIALQVPEKDDLDPKWLQSQDLVQAPNDTSAPIRLIVALGPKLSR